MTPGTTSDILLNHVVMVVRSIPEVVLLPFCNALEQLPAESRPEERRSLASSIHPHNARQKLLTLLDCWEKEQPSLAPTALAWALRAGLRTDSQHREEQSLELVWTGPNPEKVPFRRMDQALLSLIRESQHSLLLVTYISYDIPFIRNAIEDACERGVDVVVVVDSQETKKAAFDPTIAFGPKLLENGQVYIWPLSARERDDEGNPGLLHVKCAVADEKKLLVASANLTGFAMNLNMELGLLVHGGQNPSRIYRYFQALILQGVLSKAYFRKPKGK